MNKFDEYMDEKVDDYEATAPIGTRMKACKKEFTPEDFEKRFREELIDDIESYNKQKENEKIANEIRERVGKEMKDKYFPNGVPEDAPYYIFDKLGLGLEHKRSQLQERLRGGVDISEEEIKELQKRGKELQDRQHQIIGYFFDENTYKELSKKGLTGSLVSEYKKIEGLKSALLDRLQAGYNKKWADDVTFLAIFSEERNYDTYDVNHRF